MTITHRLIAVFGFGLAVAPLIGFGQAYEVSSSGTVTPEQSASAIAPADQATSEQLVKLFDVMRIRNQMQSMRKMVPAMVETQVREQMNAMTAQLSSGAKLTAQQRAAIDRILHKYVDKAMDLYPIDEMVEDMTVIYRKYLTREDVDAMIAFYGSSAGQHLLDAQPKIAQEYMPIAMQRASERMKSLTAEMMKDMATLKESAGQAQPTSK
jgi:hypothetical protein